MDTHLRTSFFFCKGVEGACGMMCSHASWVSMTSSVRSIWLSSCVCVCVHMCTWREEGEMKKSEEEEGRQTASETKA